MAATLARLASLKDKLSELYKGAQRAHAGCHRWRVGARTHASADAVLLLGAALPRLRRDLSQVAGSGRRWSGKRQRCARGAAGRGRQKGEEAYAFGREARSSRHGGRGRGYPRAAPSGACVYVRGGQLPCMGPFNFRSQLGCAVSCAARCTLQPAVQHGRRASDACAFIGAWDAGSTCHADD